MDPKRFLLWVKQISSFLVRRLGVLCSGPPSVALKEKFTRSDKSIRERSNRVNSSGIVVRDHAWDFEILEDSDGDPSFSVS